MPFGSLSVDKITTSDGFTLGGSGAAMKNRIINGAMVIDQRNAGASVTPTNGQYTLDRWGTYQTTASKFTVQQNAGSVTPPTGFRNYLGCTSSSAYSIGSADVFAVYQWIEGFNIADLMWGTSNAQTVTLSFWVRSSLTGTFGGALQNSAQNRSYPFTYTISSANTWEQKSVTITGDTSGTWLTTNGAGLNIVLSIGTGSTYSGTAGAWAGSALYSATGATSVVGTNGATFYITGVQLEVGSQATSFDYRPYGTELALCQRYFCKNSSTNVVATNGAAYTTTGMFSSGVVAGYASGFAYTEFIQYPVTMRTEATITLINTNLPTSPTAGQWTIFVSGTWLNTTTAAPTTTTATGFGLGTTFSSGTAYMYYGAWTASAEL